MAYSTCVGKVGGVHVGPFMQQCSTGGYVAAAAAVFPYQLLAGQAEGSAQCSSSLVCWPIAVLLSGTILEVVSSEKLSSGGVVVLSSDQGWGLRMSKV